MSPDKAPEACIVGCGRMGQRHAEVIKSLGFKLTAIADIYEPCCKKVIDSWTNFDKPDAYNNLDDLLKNHNPDVLIIATTADSHASQALRGIEAGIPNILLEEAVTTSLRDCQKLQKLANTPIQDLQLTIKCVICRNIKCPKISLIRNNLGFQSMTVTAGNFGMAMNGTLS